MEKDLPKVEATLKKKSSLHKYGSILSVFVTLLVVLLVLLSSFLYLRYYVSATNYVKIANALGKIGINLNKIVYRVGTVENKSDEYIFSYEAPSDIEYELLENGKYEYRVFGTYVGDYYFDKADSDTVYIPIKTAAGQEIDIIFLRGEGSLFHWPLDFMVNEPIRFSDAKYRRNQELTYGYVVEDGYKYLLEGDIVNLEWRVSTIPSKALVNDWELGEVFAEIPVYRFKADSVHDSDNI